MRRMISYGCILFLLGMAGCAPKPREILYEIDFSQRQLPSFIEKVDGFSSVEDWGRWTDADVAPTATILFREPLPKQFVVVITGQSMPFPDSEESELRVGDFRQKFYIHGVGEKTTIHVELVQEARKVEIIPSNPKSPAELELGEDRRKLGVGVMKIRIEKYDD